MARRRTSETHRKIGPAEHTARTYLFVVVEVNSMKCLLRRLILDHSGALARRW
jgi:hypothetical protein